jgi:hypothetical protein
MKNNIFLKISESFKSFFKIKDKSNNSYLDDLVNALENSDGDKLNKAYERHIKETELDYLALKFNQVAPNEFLSEIEKVPTDKKSRLYFYKRSFDMAVNLENEEVFKYLFNNNHITNSDTLLHTISDKNAYKIASILLYDLNFTVTEKMKRILTYDKDGKTHTKMLALIEKRDLFLELGENLNSDQPKEKSRINKI